MDNEVYWMYEIDFNTYKKLMKKIISLQKTQLLFYINMYLNPEVVQTSNKEIDSYLVKLTKEHYKEKIASTLEALLENLDSLSIIEQRKDEFRYFIDNQGTPYAIYYPIKGKKERLLYI